LVRAWKARGLRVAGAVSFEGMTDKRRDPPISYRPPEDLREEFRARVEKSGLSINAFITRAIFDAAPSRQSRRPVLEQQLLARLLAEAGGIRALLEVPRDAEAAAPVEALATLRDIRLLLMQAMGRAP
jgi:hypothetical protein